MGSLLVLVFSQLCILAAVLLRVITLTALLYRFSFLLHLHRCFLTLSNSNTIPVSPIGNSDWHSLNTVPYFQIIQINVWSDFICSDVYLLPNYFDSLLSSIIIDFNNSGRTLYLLQVDVINPFAPCILLSDASFCLFFKCQLSRRTKLTSLEKLQLPTVILSAPMHQNPS